MTCYPLITQNLLQTDDFLYFNISLQLILKYPKCEYKLREVEFASYRTWHLQLELQMK